MEQDEEKINGREEISKILFPEGRELGTDELAYLSRLGAQGLESLMGEVARVNEELAIIEHQTRDMASQNYQIFVQSAQTTNLIKKSLDEAKNSVELLSSSKFPEFRKKAEDFLSTGGPSKEFQNSLDGINVLLEKEEEVASVLDMPWVVRRCLANGDDKMLPEAIKILHIVMDYKKSVKSVEQIPPALNETVRSVLELQTQIQNALLQKLQSPSITLSECLQTIQLLRNFFPSDKALRFRFLQSRTNPTLPFENSRSWVFDTLTQHRAAFGQDSAHYLSTFIALQINRMLGDLHKQLEHHSGSTTSHSQIDTLFTNSTYFGESLARVGADMRGLAVPLFSDFIVKKASHDLFQAEMTFSRNLHQFNMSTCLIQERVRASFEGGEELPLDADVSSVRNEDYLRPPSQLLTFPPLGLYTNEVLQLLNVVAKCPLPQCLEISRKLNQSVAKVGNELERWGEGEWVTWEQREQALYQKMRSYYEQLLVPHLDKCFKCIFPPTALSTVTGLNISKCAEMVQIKYSRALVKAT